MMRNALQPMPLNLHKIQTHAQSNPQSAWRSGQSSPTPSNATLGSLSWFAERSATELIPLLKEAYSALREKERDLFLAAEIGKSLLENNITLKTKYEGLLQQLQLYREAQGRPRITAGTGDVNIPTTTTTDTVPEIKVEEDETYDDDPDLVPDEPYVDEDSDSPTGYSTSGLRPRQRALSKSRAQQVAVVEIEKLEKENTELQSQLEVAMKETDEREKQSRVKQKQLEKELEALKSELGGATQKVEELEVEKEKLVEVKKSLLVGGGPRAGLTPKRGEKAKDGGGGDDDEVINQLLEKLQTLEQTNDNLSKTKSNLEQKLTNTLRDLNCLKQDFEQCEFTQEDFKNLQDAYQRQFKHIAELNESLEEHRNMLVSVREKQQLGSSGHRRKHHSRDDDEGEVLRDSLGSRYSRGRSPSARSVSPSPFSTSGGRRSRRDSISSWSTVLSEAVEMMDGLMGSKKGGGAPRRTLLSELENEFFRAGVSGSSHGDNPLDSKLPPTDSDDSTPSTRADSAYQQNSETVNTTPEPVVTKSFTQLLTSPGELALDTLLSRTGFDRSFLDECFDFINEAQSVGLFEDEFYPSSEFDTMEDRMGMLGMVATKEKGELVERKGLVGWVVRLLRRIFCAVWRWCRFLGVLVAAVVISVIRGPDNMLENGDDW